jgi:hypothetical protein
MNPGHQNEPLARMGVEEHSEHSPIKIISVDGDLILEYTAPGDSLSSRSKRKWQVASKHLTSNSPYFQALLDPTKFSEGRQFSAQKQAWDESQTADSASQHALPTVRLPEIRSTSLCGEDAIELFLKILCLESLDETERTLFENALKVQSTSLVARMIELADSFSSTRIIRKVLQRVGYAYGKTKAALLARFNSALLVMKEDRIRQIIFISAFLDDSRLTRIMTHALLIAGSRFWVNGLEDPEEESLRWKHLPNNLEGWSQQSEPSSVLLS